MITVYMLYYPMEILIFSNFGLLTDLCINRRSVHHI